MLNGMTIIKYIYKNTDESARFGGPFLFDLAHLRRLRHGMAYKDMLINSYKATHTS